MKGFPCSQLLTSRPTRCNMASSAARNVPLAAPLNGSGCVDPREILLQGESQHLAKCIYVNGLCFRIGCQEA